MLGDGVGRQQRQHARPAAAILRALLLALPSAFARWPAAMFLRHAAVAADGDHEGKNGTAEIDHVQIHIMGECCSGVGTPIAS